MNKLFKKVSYSSYAKVAIPSVIACFSIFLLAGKSYNAPINKLLPISTPIPNELFGLHIHRAATVTPWPKLEFSSWRLWDAGVTWPNLETEKGKWDFRTLDKDIDLAQKHKVEIILPLGLSPTWASSRPYEQSAYKPGFAAEPDNLEDWRNYIRTVALRYKNRVHYYEIWNEPNLPRFYSGTTKQMVTLAREAYQILKDVDPTVTVISPSATGGGNGLTWLEDFLQRGGGAYADVMGYHFYGSTQPPESMLKVIQKVQAIMSKYQVSEKPLWNTETGWVIANSSRSVDPKEVGFSKETKALTMDEASAYVARSYILSWAAGVQRFYWYAWDNHVMGLTEVDGKTLKPPALAYAEVQKWLIGASMTSCQSDLEHTWTCALKRPNQYSAWIVWNPERKLTFQIPKDWKIQQVRDLAGAKRDFSSSKSLEINTTPLLLENKT